jgi:3-phenylpropionate/trans-cinnamate dioxygenase ferredoxin subunit
MVTVGEAQRVCARDDLAPGTARCFVVDGRRIAIVRIDDDFYAIDDTCSHADYSLSEGEVWTDELEIECPKHGSTFSLLTGEPQTLPATRPVPVYDLVVDGDDIKVVVPSQAEIRRPG